MQSSLTTIKVSINNVHHTDRNIPLPRTVTAQQRDYREPTES